MHINKNYGFYSLKHCFLMNKFGYAKECNLELMKFFHFFLVNFEIILKFTNFFKIFNFFDVICLPKNDIFYRRKVFTKLVHDFNPSVFVIFCNGFLLSYKLPKDNSIKLVLTDNTFKDDFFKVNDFFDHLNNSFFTDNIFLEIRNKSEIDLYIFDIFSCDIKLKMVSSMKIFIKFIQFSQLSITHVCVDDAYIKLVKSLEILIILLDNSRCTYNFIANTCKSSIFLVMLKVLQHSKSLFNFNFTNFKGSYVRLFLNLIINGIYSKNFVDVIFLGMCKNIFDFFYHVTICKEYVVTLCNLRSIVKNNSKCFFTGLICVEKSLGNIKADLNCVGLLLSKNAEVFFKPQLNICSYDILCTHSVAIGVLENDEIFYFKSRGISLLNSRNLLIRGFLFVFLLRKIDIFLFFYIKKILEKVLK